MLTMRILAQTHYSIRYNNLLESTTCSKSNDSVIMIEQPNHILVSRLSFPTFYLSASFLSVFFIRLLLAIVVVIVLFVFPFTSSIAMLPRVNDTNAIRSRMKDVLYRNLVPTDGMHCICNSISTILSVHLTRLGCPLPSQFEHHTKML